MRPPLSASIAAHARAAIIVALCASPAASASADALAEARGIVGEARCSHDGECRTIAYGSRPCGGPAGFLAWSVRGTDRGALEAALRRADPTGAGPLADRYSTCEVLADPGAKCRKDPGSEHGRCILGAARRGQPALPQR